MLYPLSYEGICGLASMPPLWWHTVGATRCEMMDR
jgi:hypothetical protein